MLSTLTSTVNLRRPAWVSAETLNVAPELQGAPLASPMRRLGAIAIDVLLVAILSGLDPFWLGVAVVVFLYQMRSRDRGRSGMRRAWLLGIAVLCLWLAIEQGWQTWSSRAVAPQMPPATSAPASAPVLAPNTKAPPAVTHAETDAERIEALETELLEARKPHVFRWQTELKGWWEELGVGFGWAIVYFSLVPTWLRGQSLGKVLLRLRVVELTGKPLNVRICFSRYGGYVAGLATGLFGFAQILWDANRQSIQDKVAHTVVVDMRAPYRIVESSAPPEATSTSP